MFHNFHEKNVNLHVYQLQPLYIQSQILYMFRYFLTIFSCNISAQLCCFQNGNIGHSVSKGIYKMFIIASIIVTILHSIISATFGVSIWKQNKVH